MLRTTPHGQWHWHGPVTWRHVRLPVRSPAASWDRAMSLRGSLFPKVPAAPLILPASWSSAVQGGPSTAETVARTHWLHPFYSAGHWLRGSPSLGPTSPPTLTAWVSELFVAHAPQPSPGWGWGEQLHLWHGSDSPVAPPRSLGQASPTSVPQEQALATASVAGGLWQGHVEHSGEKLAWAAGKLSPVLLPQEGSPTSSRSHHLSSGSPGVGQAPGGRGAPFRRPAHRKSQARQHR